MRGIGIGIGIGIAFCFPISVNRLLATGF